MTSNLTRSRSRIVPSNHSQLLNQRLTNRRAPLMQTARWLLISDKTTKIQEELLLWSLMVLQSRLIARTSTIARKLSADHTVAHQCNTMMMANRLIEVGPILSIVKEATGVLTRRSGKYWPRSMSLTSSTHKARRWNEQWRRSMLPSCREVWVVHRSRLSTVAIAVPMGPLLYTRSHRLKRKRQC